MININGQYSLVGAQLLTPPRPIDSQTGEYSDDYSVEEWKALWKERQAEFSQTQKTAENNLKNWLDEHADTEVTRAFYLDGQLTAVFGSDNAKVSNGMNYAFEYSTAKNDGEKLGLTGDELDEFVETRVENELHRKYGDRLTVTQGDADTMGTMADYREELFGGSRWPAAENRPQQPEIDWNAPSPVEAGTWQGPIRNIDNDMYVEMVRTAFEADQQQ
ncbi:MAG TPA: hypothetical protein DHW36_18895 [Thalassospira sp.]|nr:hypothetical protein [Thalassospira sp.]|tara:strand:+ start:467 stop:1120 length:654 start_codon:yes stop_codon:yes gene_type:complete